jgi:predicted HTH transcriptional regulator
MATTSVGAGRFIPSMRKALASGDVVVDDSAQKTTQKLLDLISQDPSVTRKTLAEALGITADGVKYHLRKLQEEGRLRRVGPDKGGHWEVLATDDRPKGRR